MAFTLGVKKLVDNALHPTRPASNEDYQLLCCEDTVIPAHSTGILKSGLTSASSEGLYVRLIPDVPGRTSISGPVVNKSYGKDLDVLVFNAGIEDITVKRGNPIARMTLLVAQAQVVVLEEIKPLKDPETFECLQNINSQGIDNVSDELRWWCLAKHSDTARIRPGDSKRMSSEITQWVVHGFDENGRNLWQKPVQVKMPYIGLKFLYK